MRHLQVSTDVFARIWSLRQNGEDTEDAILRRILWQGCSSPSSGVPKESPHAGGLLDQRFGVDFPEGFVIERRYLGRNFRASINDGQWVIEGMPGRFSRLNELSRAIHTKTENAWANWFFIDERGRRRPVSDLRDEGEIRRRSGRLRQSGERKMQTVQVEGKTRWCDDVSNALRDLGGNARLSKIYQKVREIRESAGRSTPKSLEEVVRKELEMRSSDSEVYDADRGEDWFEMAEGKGSGIWALRSN